MLRKFKVWLSLSLATSIIILGVSFLFIATGNGIWADMFPSIGWIILIDTIIVAIAVYYADLEDEVHFTYTVKNNGEDE